MPTDVEIEIRGERLTLLPERAVHWARERTLFAADTHWGKAAAFRAASLPIPEAMTDDDLARLARMVERTGARRLIVLGDLLHARAGRSPETLGAIAAWRAAHPGLEILLVRGNHDRGAGDPPGGWDVRCVDEPFALPPFVLRHKPGEPADEDGGGYGLAGHLHPAARLTGRGGQGLRLPCFWFQPHGAVLPAFGSFTGMASIAPRPGDRVFVIAGGAVLPASLQ
jgi:DNA ligase-associated metallophosphoesterase